MNKRWKTESPLGFHLERGEEVDDLKNFNKDLYVISNFILPREMLGNKISNIKDKNNKACDFYMENPHTNCDDKNHDV